MLIHPECGSDRGRFGLRGTRMDVLSQVLSAVRFEAAFYFKVNASAPWVTTNPSMDEIGSIVMPHVQHVIPFHVMIDGDAWAWSAAGDTEPQTLRSGEIMILPQGAEHFIASDQKPNMIPKVDVEPYRDAAKRVTPYNHVQIGGDGRPATFVCGYFGCDARPFNPLLSALPGMMIVRPTDSTWALMQNLIVSALDEDERPEAGSQTVLAKLSELMFVQTLRHYIETLSEDSVGWISGLRDERVGAVLRLIHTRPAEPLTLDKLAKEAGMSRSALADRFAAYTGEPPSRYLTRWRMQLASSLLSNSSVSIAEAAETVGYSSEAAFKRAFKKHVGETPGRARRASPPAIGQA
ncbi:MAG TPA: AraC family transcriptional regulator [Hyphomonas sp.]|nr:AraC family transcriptional regulator [Hyphomonas sp.]